jgi:predicted ATPase
MLGAVDQTNMSLTEDSAVSTIDGPPQSEDARLLTRIRIQNYKSIGKCDINLGPLTFLIGPNGSGKSNFLDALGFVSDALQTSLDHALKDRGGIADVRRRSSGHPNHFGIRLDFQLESQLRGHYSFRVGARTQGGYEIQTEECVIEGRPQSRYMVQRGQVAGLLNGPASLPDRLYLVAASGLPEFRPVFDALSKMSFYNLNPDELRELQPPSAGLRLERDGFNIADVMAQLARNTPERKERIEEYLGKIVPGILGVDSKTIGPRETLEFRQTVAGSKAPWRFLAANMSDGTLRALGVLVALFQDRKNVPLVGIEEPEVALHPAAAAILLAAIRDASQDTQVIVTSHSADLLDESAIDADSLLAVVSENGTTKIGHLNEAGRKVLQEHLYTAGELLRINQLFPDPKETDDQRQLTLFDEMST